MRASGTTLFVEGQSRLHGCHPFSKLFFIPLTGVAAYVEPGTVQAAVFLIVLNMTLAAAAGVLPTAWKITWRTLLPLALFMLPIHGFLYPGNHTPLFSRQGLTLYAEGLRFAGTILAQLAAVLSASLLFVLTTHPADLIAALTKAGWPSSIAYLLGSPLLMLPAMRDRTGVIRAAQQARGLDSGANILGRIRSLPPLVAPLVLGAFAEIEQRAIALELRGFHSSASKTSLRRVPDSTAQRLVRRLFLVATVFLILYRIMI
ncbi:MAG: energy-coupling factor transporter transmembrane protein EcfT [Desulfovibrionaceae bacterium]|nr:energy-coupling factor transporter transmembrane protein EcfT [Desulfovibrionaceae bacterium]